MFSTDSTARICYRIKLIFHSRDLLRGLDHHYMARSCACCVLIVRSRARDVATITTTESRAAQHSMMQRSETCSAAISFPGVL